MKGISHFSAGVALASCFPQAVEAAAAGHPLYFILGGVCGLLPDTLDFKLLRFFYRHDMEVVPDPNRPDPLLMAQAVAHAIHRAKATGRPVRIKIHTTLAGSGLWHQYRLRFDTVGRRITVAFTGTVTTSRAPAPGQPCPPAEAAVPLDCDVALDYAATNEINIFDGPVFSMEPQADGRVCARFIPWHRQWSHSLTLAAGLGVFAGVCWGGLAGLVAGGAFALHTLVDQMGIMGSNLFPPFTRRRVPGFQVVRSDNGLANFAVVWCSLLLTYWNLARLAPVLDAAPALPKLFLYGAALPFAVVALVSRRLKGRQGTRPGGRRRRRTGRERGTTPPCRT